MRNGFLLRTTKQLNGGAVVSGLGFLAYLGLSALGAGVLADAAAVVFGVVSVYVFISAVSARGRDRDAVSYSLLWGTGALALLMGGCGVLTVKMAVGL